MTKISREEQETIVRFNGAEKYVSIFTNIPAHIKRFDGYCAANPDVWSCYREDQYGGKWYRCENRKYAMPRKGIVAKASEGQLEEENSDDEQ